MLLRRVIEHVREQNWAAVGIDFVIVVVGVFVGIQVSNWNAAQADERLGRAYAARLTADLKVDLAWRQALAAYYGVVLESVERANALLSDSQSDPKELVIHAYRASEINYRAPSRATWDEIVSSGHTALLPIAVANSAGEYFAFDTARNVLDILNESAYRHRVRALMPLSLQKALREPCSDLRDDLQQITGFMTDCTLDVEPGVIAATATALRADAAMQAELRNQYSDVYSAHANIRGDAAAIAQALAALNSSRPARAALP